MSKDSDFDVVVVGLGPVGLMMVNLLGQQGHRVLGIDKIEVSYAFPRAIHLDAEIIRILALADLSQNLIPHLRPSPYLELCDQQFRPLLRASIGFYSGYQANDFLFYQPELEGVLREGCKRFSNVQLWYGKEVTGVGEDQHNISVVSGERVIAHCRYLIACDGAKSLIRSRLGLQQQHFGFEKGALKVDALEEGDDTIHTDHVQKICSHRTPWVRMKGRGQHRRWELNYAMTLPREAYERPETVKQLLGEIGVDTQKLEIVHAVWYRFRGVLSKVWRKGGIFLAGDAAHTTPPYIGQGMCAGFRDALNLSWKLNAVLKGSSGDELLDTYAKERMHQVRIHIVVAILIGRLFTTRLWYLLRVLSRIPGLKQKLLNIKLPLDPQGKTGVWGAGKASRRLFPQFVSNTGVLSDQLLQKDWALVAVGKDFSGEEKMLAQNVGLATLAFSEEEKDAGFLLSWAIKRKARYFIVRPDLYVYSSGNNAVDLIHGFESDWKLKYGKQLEKSLVPKVN